MRPITVNDLRWSWSGDLVLGNNGDLADTTENPLLSLIQEIKTRLRSTIYDWATQPHLGASLGELVGRPNNMETANEGKLRIISALTRDAFLGNESVQVRYMPIAKDQLVYRVTIILPGMNVEPLVLNTLLDLESFSVTFV